VPLLHELLEAIRRHPLNVRHRENGLYKVVVSRLAKELGTTPQRIAYLLRLAKEQGLIEVVYKTQNYRGHTYYIVKLKQT